jgi:hypothetical protein
MYKTSVYIPSKMWSAFDKNDQLLSLSYFIQLKAVHRKPIFYNYNPHIVCKKIGVSVNSLRTHIKTLTQIGVAQIKDGHLILMGTNSLRKIYQGSVKNKNKTSYINIGETVKDTKVVVKSFPILCSFTRQCKKVIKWDTANINHASRKKGTFHFGYITLSNKNALSLLNRKSIATIQRAKKRLKQLNMINYRSKYMPFEEYLRFFPEDPKDSRIKYLDGKCVVQMTNQYMLVGKEYNNKYIISTPSSKKHSTLLTTTTTVGSSIVGANYLVRRSQEV